MCRQRLWVFAAGVAGLAALKPATAQPVFSVDFQGPLMGAPDAFFGIPITEGDLLVAVPIIPAPGPLPIPGVAVFAGMPSPAINLGLPAYPGAVGHPPGIPGFVEVDALSFGRDWLLTDPPPHPWVWSFSVDEFAVGVFPGAAPPNVFGEGAAGFMEASADIFLTFPPGAMPPGPLPPGAAPAPWNADWIDGDGVAPPPGPHPSMPFLVGLGLIEPNPPTFGAIPDPGDNLDAMDVDTPGVGPGVAPFPIYFSLDFSSPDPFEPFPPVNSGSAIANGFVGGDVLVTMAPGGPPMVYAPATVLGLDMFGPNRDDLDALVLVENGVPGYQPSVMPFPPYDWGPGGADMLMFSVRRGSAIILAGTPDSIFFLPIEEGDILVPPIGAGLPPGIFIAAENLGLLTCRTHGVCPGDELDALDLSPDCNVNGLPDVMDIFFGFDVDCNGNFIPDGCEGFPPTETPGVNCSDGLDNDCDGAVDCGDPDCATDPFCGGVPCGNGTCEGGFGENPCTCAVDCGAVGPEVSGSTCLDGIDNDCNGLTDCDDPACCGAVGCAGAPESVCGDGVDNDCDGCVDGADSDCGGTEAGACADGLDNDCDGSVDCSDSDCAGDPACTGSCGNGTCEPALGEDPCNCPADCGGPGPESCTDGIDNDCDGATDCADSDCCGLAVCCLLTESGPGVCVDGCDNDCDGCVDGVDHDCGGVETSCTDGVDNDCDGFVSCGDLDCCGDPACCIGSEVGAGVCSDGCDNDCDGCTDGADSECGGVETSCTDGIDNDCDGSVDCADSDCAGDPACGPCGDGTCDATIGENPCTCPPDCGGPGPEFPGSACSDGIDNDCNGLVDCADPGCCGDPACTPAETSCTDGVDNDCDGFFDCFDTDCCGDPACCTGVEVSCTDGCDNDCDGAIDCADFDCCGTAACCTASETGAACGDGCDNDCDGCTDGADSDCGGVETSCTDSADNDCDGDVDCADSDCASDPACTSCTIDADCDDADVCTCDDCTGGTCVFTAISTYGDVFPQPCGNGVVDVDDILCVLGGFASFAACPGGDLFPECTGNGVIDVDDILAVLRAFGGAGAPACGC